MKIKTLQDITRTQDARIYEYLEGNSCRQFWYAQCPVEGSAKEHIRTLHELGFDNYPTAQIPGIDALHPHLFFFERILGAQVVGADGYEGDFFHSWCAPLVNRPDDVYELSADPGQSALWRAYETAIIEYMRETPAENRLPIAFPGLSPLDMACNLCGAEALFLMLYEESEAAEHLLSTIVSLQILAYQRIKSLGARVVSYYGFPGVYCNDLQLPSLSPSHIQQFMLKLYARIAAECDGLLLALLTHDTDVLQDTLRIPGLMGCAFDRRLPLATISKYLGSKLFIVQNYCYDDALDKPALRDGVWWNPIVQSYSRELTQVYSQFNDHHSLLISIERPTLAEVCAVRQDLQRQHRFR